MYGGDETRPLVRLLCCALVGFTRRYEEITEKWVKSSTEAMSVWNENHQTFPTCSFFWRFQWGIEKLRGVSCAWVNVFFFVDSPYKRRAARKITFWWLGWFEVLGMNQSQMEVFLELQKIPRLSTLSYFLLGISCHSFWWIIWFQLRYDEANVLQEKFGLKFFYTLTCTYRP